jgi:hypothetical protein
MLVAVLSGTCNIVCASVLEIYTYMVCVYAGMEVSDLICRVAEEAKVALRCQPLLLQPLVLLLHTLVLEICHALLYGGFSHSNVKTDTDIHLKMCSNKVDLF